MPPRTDLRPVEKWLPFMLNTDPVARNRSVQMGDHAIIVHNPLIPKAAGPTACATRRSSAASSAIAVATARAPRWRAGTR